MEKCQACGHLNDPLDARCYKCNATRGGVAVLARPAPAAIPGREGRTQGASVTRAGSGCESCRRPLAGGHASLRRCLHCGWDQDRHERRCRSCSGPVVLHDAQFGESKGGGAEARFGFGGAVVAVVADQVGRRIGVLIGLYGVIAIALAVTSVGALYKAVFTTFHCAMCHKEPSVEVLSARERAQLSGIRKRWSAITLGCAIGAAGCSWLAFFAG